MPELFGHTRARIAARHALITPDNFVTSSLPGITGAKVVIPISGSMGAGFAQLQMIFDEGGRAVFEQGAVQTFGYVMQGAVTVRPGARKTVCGPGGYFFSPAGQRCELTSPEPGTRLTLFQRRFVPVADAPAPGPFIGYADAIQSTPFLGDPATQLQVLLPEEPAFDVAVNILSYEPGGHLPFVEVHVMEHGLIMLEGQGVYRLEDDWYPVQAGDVIWMAPFCAQWFVAMGKSPARYLYYKDVNRVAL